MTSSVAVKPVVQQAPKPLTLNDRCDHCGAEALTRVIMPAPEGSNYKDHTDHYDLLFCGHHTNKYELKLVAAGGEFFRKQVNQEDRLKGSDH